MRSSTLARCLLLLFLAFSVLELTGCQSLITIRTPDQFGAKKMKEDPPPDYNPNNNDLGGGAAKPADAEKK
jgi:hypothetical protein